MVPVIRHKRIFYKVSSWAVLYAGFYFFPPSGEIPTDWMQILIVGVLFGVLGASIHDSIGHVVIRVLHKMAGWTPVKLVAMYIIILTYAAFIGASLWAINLLVTLSIPGLGAVAMDEAVSMAPIGAAVTVVVVEAINETVEPT